MADRAACDAWMKEVLGLDPAAYPLSDQPIQDAGLTGGEGLDPSSPMGDMQSPSQDADAARPDDSPSGRTHPPGKKPDADLGSPPSRTNAPGASKAPVKLTLTSMTEASQPANWARTKLGVGERVTLKLTPVAGDWKVAGSGTLSSSNGSTVVLTASGKPGKITVSVTASGQTKQLVFAVIAPSSVHQDTIDTEHHDVGVPNAGFHGQVYCGPADVNFVNITFLEAEVGCKASGSWQSKQGKGHGPNKTPIGFTDTVVSGKGTKSYATDHCWSGFVPGLKLTDWSGEMTFSIPWTYQCKGVTGKIATVVQVTKTSKDGTTSTKKAGGSSGDFVLS